MPDNFPENLSDLTSTLNTGAPDEVVIMPTESFMKEISKQLENTAFVALNITRSVVLRPVEGEAGTTTVTILGVGFEMEDVNNLPDFMHMLTGKGEILVTAETDEIKEAVECAIKENNDRGDEASLVIPHSEDNSVSNIMEF
jgi:hypothetical protein